MNEQVAAVRPWHLWAVGVLSLMWNAIGVTDFTMTKLGNETYLAQVTAEQRAWLDSTPLLLDLSWAVGVWGALAGSLLLLARHRWAVIAFAASFAGLVCNTVYRATVSDMPGGEVGAGHGLAFTAILWAVAGTLLWYAMRMRARGVLR